MSHHGVVVKPVLYVYKCPCRKSTGDNIRLHTTQESTQEYTGECRRVVQFGVLTSCTGPTTVLWPIE